MEELVLFETRGRNDEIGVATLVRERPLNSLLLETIELLSDQIYAWLADDKIRCIVLDSSSERAFCAGADITKLYHKIKASDEPSTYADKFFLHEYRLDYALHTANKPIIAWGNGIVMGGGLGLLGGCSHRIGTRTTRIAMPEITIGLFPDAGGTWFLSQLPDGLGDFAGLTGCQLSAADGLALGLLDVVVDAESKSAIFQRLEQIEFTGTLASDKERITAGLSGFALRELPPQQLQAHRAVLSELVEACRASDDYLGTFEEALSRLPEDDWLQGALQTYRNGSPLTAQIFVEQMRRAKKMSLAEMFRMELAIAYRCARGEEFPEGVRALMVDKDKNPQWQFSNYREVSRAVIEQHFEPSWAGAHPLADLGR